MKKIVLILLISIYSLSAFGVSIKEFYCCGKLVSVTVVVADEGKDKCGMGDNNEGCCKTKYQFFKVKDKHLTTGEFTTPAKYFTDVVSFNPTYQTIFLSQLVEIINGSHAPPFHTGVPIYISNCVFRV